MLGKKLRIAIELIVYRLPTTAVDRRLWTVDEQVILLILLWLFQAASHELDLLNREIL